MGKVVAICQSRVKGTRKSIIDGGVLREEFGLIDDAHADPSTHRQVSLLAIESIERMRNQGFNVGPGDFAENITTEAIDLLALPVGSRINVGGQAVLEITQHGKKCHQGCAIFQETGKCIMPKEGVFARVIAGGQVKAGDSIGLP
jgi:MOSC domain-containing protein YiiM